MSLNIKEITETLEFNREDLKGNRQLTNEMIVDDIMLGLGYNKRRDRSIQRLFDGLVDWIVTTNSGKKVAVKVLAYDECIEEANDTEETIKYCLNARYSILLIITGLILRVLRYDKKELNYVHVTDIKLDTDLSAEDQKLVTAISKDTFDIEYIDSLLKCNVTYMTFIDTIRNNIGTITNVIQGLFTIENPSTDVIQGYLDRLLNGNNIISNTEQSSEELDRAVQALSDANQRLNDANETIDSLTSDKKVLTEKLEKAQNTINELKMESFKEDNSEELNAKDEEIERLKEENKQLLSNVEQLKQSGPSTGVSSQDMQSKIDSYVQQIRDLSIQLSDANEEKDKALADLEEMKKEVEELSGSDLKFAERLLETADSDPEDDRSYVAVINKELLNYEDIHTFIGRCLQKLYDLKSFDAQRYIFDGDIFELDKNARFADVVMGNNTYDILLKTSNENEELNKLRTVFSHFDDVTFVCKKIGTLRKDINSRYGVPEEKEVVQLESDDYIPEDTGYSEEQIEETYEMPSDTSDGLFGDNTSNEIFGSMEDTDSNSLFGEDDASSNGEFGEEENYEMPDDTSDSLFGENEQGYSEDNTFGVEQTLGDNQGYTEQGYMEQGYSDDNQGAFDNQGYSEENQMPTEEFEGEQQIPYFDEETEMPAEMESHLLVGQLMNIDMLIWSEENVQFKNIKYISTNIITFGISNQVDSYDKLLCKCIDAVFAIEAFNGSKDLVYTIKQKDFSAVNNFIKVYSPEYAQYPRINGTRFVVAGIESVQQVAAALLDICNLMGISTEEIFLYFEAETNSQYIIENFDFDENAIRIAETNSYIPEEGVTPHEAIAIIKGDMFNHIVITKNSLKVHKEIFNKALAVKTKYLGLVIESNDNVYEIIGDILEAARRENINIDYRAIGNVIGENYMLVSNNESKVAEEHVSMMIGGENIYISKVEDWQVPHSLIKVHTAIFNNTAIAVKSSVNADAINFYGQQFDTSEPSLGLAVNSFVDYVASCVKE